MFLKHRINISNCKHEMIYLGKFYRMLNKEYMTSTREIEVAMRYICKKCNIITDKSLTIRRFDISRESDLIEKNEYIKRLELEGYIPEYQIGEKTVIYQMENKLKDNG